MKDLSRFKGGNGHWLTKALFLELCDGDTSCALYTLKDRAVHLDGKTYPSLYELFLQEGDPTEYSFAQTYLGGYQHWKRLTEFTLSDYVEEWREELNVKLQSEDVARMKKLADEGNATAAKYMADKAWLPKRKAGAPSKAEKAGAVKKHVAKVTTLDKYLDRIK